MLDSELNRAVKQLERVGDVVTEQVKKSTKKLAIDELNIISSQASQAKEETSSASKKANQTVKYLEDANGRILVLLAEQQSAWDCLARQAAAGFQSMGEQMRKVWENLCSALGIEWSAVEKFISSAWQSLSTLMKNQWQQASSFISRIWQSLFQGVIQPIWKSLQQLITSLWNEHLSPLYQNFAQLVNAFGQLLASLGQLIWGLWNSYIFPFVQNISNLFAPVVSSVLQAAGNAFYSLAGAVIDFASGGLVALTGICNFLTGVFTGQWASAWNGVYTIFAGVWNSISSLGRGILNALIQTVNAFLSGVVGGVNAAVNAVNSIRLTIPRWVPKYGGSAIGFSLPTLSAPQIPMLANGGVIRQPTLAMLGEYSGASGDPEIAAPQSMLRETVSQQVNQLAPLLQIMIELLKEQNQLHQSNQTTILLDGEQLYRSNERYRVAKGYPVGLNPNFR